MGSVTSPTEGKIILITGINGYVASTVGLSLLQHGYTVRGTSRDPAHEAVLRNGPYKPHSSNFQYVCVADITVPGAFDKAVTGVFSILPMAAPVSFAVQGLEAFMGPAVKSVTSILHSAVKHAGPQLSSVVYLSSVAAVWDYAVGMADPSYEFSEKDWNEWAEKTALEVGDENGAWLMWYPASKAAAEKAIWKFKDENKPPFSISSVLPAFIYGPPAYLPSPVNSSTVPPMLSVAFQLFTGELQTVPLGPPGVDPAAGPFVDIRDVSAMYLWCLGHPKESNGERFLSCVGMTCAQAIADILRDAYPDRKIPGADTRGSEGVWAKEAGWVDGYSRFRLKKCEDVMGIKYRGFKESLLDTVKAFEEAGC